MGRGDRGRPSIVPPTSMGGGKERGNGTSSGSMGIHTADSHSARAHSVEDVSGRLVSRASVFLSVQTHYKGCQVIESRQIVESPPHRRGLDCLPSPLHHKTFLRPCSRTSHCLHIRP